MASPVVKKYKNKKIRMIECHGHVFFVGKDVASVLGYKLPRKAILDHVDSEDRKSLKWRDSSKSERSYLWGKNDYQPKMIINESGVYALIFASDLPSAKKFKHWVTHEVLPSIRKTGSYGDQRLLHAPKSQLFLTLYKQSKHMEAVRHQNHSLIAEKKIFRSTKKNVPVGQVAKIICNSGYHIGRNTFFKWLRDNGYLIRNGRQYNIPKQQYIDQGLFVVTEHVIHDVSEIMATTVLVTPKGQQYFVKKFLRKVNQNE